TKDYIVKSIENLLAPADCTRYDQLSSSVQSYLQGQTATLVPGQPTQIFGASNIQAIVQRIFAEGNGGNATVAIGTGNATAPSVTLPQEALDMLAGVPS